ncbi:MAG: ATP-binding protein [Bacillota bacterium]
MQKKIIILLTVIVLIAVSITSLLTHNLLTDNYINGIKDRLVDNGYIISEYISRNKNLTISDINKFSGSVIDKIDTRITMVNDKGIVLIDTDSDVYKLDNHKNRPEIQTSYNGEVGISKRYSNTLEKDMYYVAIPCKENELGISVIRLSVPLNRINAFEIRLYKNIAFGSLFGIILSLLLGIKFINALIKPIKELNIATKRIANGNFDRTININSDDEFEELASNFNKMTYEIKLMMNEINNRNAKMNTILSSMQNSLIALDNRGDILFLNKSFEKDFNVIKEKVKGKNVFSIIDNKKLTKSIEKILKNKKNKFEVKIDDQIINVTSTQIVDEKNINQGVLINLYDITEMKKLEKMRTDFVANVSHELKTPLTSIRGFIETLKNGAINKKEVRDKFLNIIDVEASRLSSLISDILTLSDIENNELLVEKSKIDLVSMINSILKRFENKFEKKSIKVYFEHDENHNYLGNKKWIKQVFINLIDNAIKYNVENGKIFIRLKNDSNNIIFVIEDSGIGIDKKYHDRLFERFYRVDKARSKEIGGTGLGLAIVKHVILSEGGSVEVESHKGQGTRFIIKLNKT